MYAIEEEEWIQMKYCYGLFEDDEYPDFYIHFLITQGAERQAVVGGFYTDEALCDRAGEGLRHYTKDIIKLLKIVEDD